MDALKGIALLARTPRLWPYCFLPFLLALATYVGLGLAGLMIFAPYLGARLASGAVWFAEAGIIVLWLLLFPFFYLLLASAFVGLIFEPLSREVEKEVRGIAVPEVKLTFGQSFGDTVARLALSIGLVILSLIVGSPLGPLAWIPGLLVAALVGLLDYTAPTYLRRGETLSVQWNHLRKNWDGQMLAFALIAGAISLIPFIGVFFAPGLIAGGTLLTLRKSA